MSSPPEQGLASLGFESSPLDGSRRSFTQLRLPLPATVPRHFRRLVFPLCLLKQWLSPPDPRASVPGLYRRPRPPRLRRGSHGTLPIARPSRPSGAQVLKDFEAFVPAAPPLRRTSPSTVPYGSLTHLSEAHLGYHLCRERSLTHPIRVLPQDLHFPSQRPRSAWRLALSHPTRQRSSSARTGAPLSWSSWIQAQGLACIDNH